MIVGNGQLAKAFKGSDNLSEFIVFASGVANSSCVDQNEFEREKSMLIKCLDELDNRKIIYFSSCALSASDYSLNSYYEHKKKMEELIKSYTDQFYIFRVPQVFGKLKKHPTLLNFLYFAIKEQKEIKVYDGAYRYVIELSDLKNIVLRYIATNNPGIVLDVANTYRYSVLDIVHVLEKAIGQTAIYELLSSDDRYLLDLEPLKEFMNHNGWELWFGKDYLFKKVKRYIQDHETPEVSSK